MRKNLRLLAAASALCLAPAAASAQYYIIPFVSAGMNPGGLNTDSEVPVTRLTGWNTLFTGTAVTAATPEWSAVQALPFAFEFNGQPVTHCRISTSGVLTFDTTATVVPSVNNTILPAADVPDKSICVWGLTLGGGNDFLITKTFGTAPNRQYWVQFNSASQPGTTAVTSYWSIVLQESRNTIYIVDQRTGGGNISLTLGVQMSATQALQVNGSPNINSRTTSTSSPLVVDNTYYMIEPGAQPAVDMAMRSAVTPSRLGAGASVTITGSARNLGLQPVTSYEVGYSVNGGAPQIYPISGINLGSLSTNNFTHSVPLSLTTPGTYRLKIWANQPNGQLDPKAANDTTWRVIEVADSLVQRNVIMESFTSSTCGPCRGGNINVRSVMAANPGLAIKIAYQQNFPAPGNDPYYTLESGARFNYYGLSGVPDMMLDGGWNGNSNFLTGPILNQFYNVPAYMTVAGSMSRSGNTINVSATMVPYVNADANTLVCHVLITERHTRNNARTNGETHFYDVMKKMMPDQNGTLLPALTSRQPYTLTQSYTFPAGNNVEHLDSLEAVIFVQDVITRQVLNGATYGQRLLGQADEVTLGALSVAPNPAVAGRASIHLALTSAQTVRADVVDALGRVVATVPAAPLAPGAHELVLRLPAAAHGLYLVRVQTGGVTRSRRLVVE